MGLVILLCVLPFVVFSFIVGLVISFVLDRIVRKSCHSLRLEYAEIILKKSRSLLNVGEFFLTSFLAMAIWYFSWPVFSERLDRYLIESVPETLSGQDKWNAALNVYIQTFSVYGFVLGLIPGLAAIICFYAIRKIALAKVKSVSRS
jgi:hypothetical protein